MHSTRPLQKLRRPALAAADSVFSGKRRLPKLLLHHNICGVLGLICTPPTNSSQANQGHTACSSFATLCCILAIRACTVVSVPLTCSDTKTRRLFRRERGVERRSFVAVRIYEGGGRTRMSRVRELESFSTYGANESFCSSQAEMNRSSSAFSERHSKPVTW